MARHRVTVTVNGRQVTHQLHRTRTGGRLLMPSRTIPSGRDLQRRRHAKHRHQAGEE